MIRTMIHVSLLIPLLGSLLLTSCNQAKDTSASPEKKAPGARLFEYDRNVAVRLADDTARTIDGIVVRDAHFASCSPQHGPVKCYLVRPAAEGSYAGILFFHWLGRPRGDREEFLDEAIELARRGVVSLLVQGYFPWIEDPVNGLTDRQQVIDQTIDTRRALDLLLRESGVDSQRIAYVGHDYGAMFGAIMAGLESRVKAYVFVAGMGNFADWSLKYWPATATAGEKAYRDALEPVDPIHFVPHAAPAALLFQFANQDKYITKEVAQAFSDAASSPKTVRWYESKHDMFLPEAARDRHEWLAEHLGFAKH